ncbi:family 20 glycosylhydrolase [Chitinophaga pendula]|uniref:beta-N-acetylhexosaminidase n=1 Tax=Chitinophaga TaxID=79328 RepID=UPI0018DFFD2A|nr:MULTISPECIES: family 20 glycosylhydrolase [Chitinophaga]UCJ07980.1 family 20 glycosylhydrolase [Chitinophaga pendula]
MNKNSVLQCMLLAGGLFLAACGHPPGDNIPKGQLSIIPMPVSVKAAPDSFLLDKQTVLVAAHPAEKQIAQLFNEWLKELTGYELKIADSGDKNAIVLRTAKDTSHPEGYTLKATHDLVTITGYDSSGTFYGMQTLLQLLPVQKGQTLWIPGADITDYPRFSHRGLMLDVCRHFFPIDFIKKYIDLMAMHKLNTFHWHLTDDQGWRIEIRKYPALQEVASRRKETMEGPYSDQKYDGKPYGGYYTQAEIREVVKYAAERFITVVPEIEMPGHALAALTAYPNLGCTGGPYEVGTHWGVYDDVFCAGNDSVFLFLQDVLTEVMDLFPGKYIHIGGDESPKVRWEKCPKCQQRIHNEGLKDEHALQSYFIQRIEKYLNSKGRQIIGWDEILEGGLAPNATVMSWRGIDGGITAAKQHHDVIMTPTSHLYFDYYQSKGKTEPLAIGGFIPLSKVYSYDPIPQALNKEEARFIKGAQANLWTEYIENGDHVEYMMYPRTVALSEVLWTPADKRNYDDFIQRLKLHFKRLDLKRVNYAKHVFEVRGTVAGNGKGNIQVKFETALDSGKITYTTDGSTPLPGSNQYTQPIRIDSSCTIRAAVFQDDKQFGNEYNQSFTYHKGVGKTVQLATTPNESYYPGNAFMLADGIEPAAVVSDPHWFGYSGGNFEATLALDSIQDIHQVGLDIYSEKQQWVYAPKQVTFSISEDGKQFKEVYKHTFTNASGLIKLRGNVKEVRGKYIKVQAQNAGKISAGAPGAGSGAWLFVDEIVVN